MNNPIAEIISHFKTIAASIIAQNKRANTENQSNSVGIKKPPHLKITSF